MGYNSDIFRPEDKRPKDEVTRLIFAGKIAEKKGVMSLLRSLSIVGELAGEEIPRDSLKLSLAGSTGNEEEYKAIQELAKDCPYEVTFLGRLSQAELAACYNESDIFVLPSFFEGIPLVAIEALSCGDRVVMTDLPGVREWLGSVAEGADVIYVPLPEMRNTDEPVEEALPDFERRLAEALLMSIRQRHTRPADVSGISWKKIAAAAIRG